MALIYASPSGSDAASGSQSQPVKTLAAAVGKAKPRDAILLAPGLYAGNVTVPKRLGIFAERRSRSLVKGRLVFAPGSAGSEVDGVAMNGKNAEVFPSPTINAADVTFRYVSLTNEHAEIGFMIGSATYGRADRFALVHSVVHNCGRLDRTANPKEQDHGVYIGASTGFYIAHTAIYGNADRGIQLYPDAQKGLIDDCTITGNGCGIIFSGADGKASSGNLVVNSTITGNKSTVSQRYDVMSWYPTGQAPGTDNLVDGCILGTVPSTLVGFALGTNLIGEAA